MSDSTSVASSVVVAAGCAGGQPQVHTAPAAAPQPRRGPAFHPVLVEVAGCMEDDVVREVTQRLRKYRNRYTPLLRCMFTLVATTVPEARLFGDGDAVVAADPVAAAATAASKPLFTAPRYAVSVNKTYPLVRRLYPSEASRQGGRVLKSDIGAGVSAACGAPPPWTDNGECCGMSEDASLASSPRDRAVQKLENFMTYHFLPLAMLHNDPSHLRKVADATAPDQQGGTFVLRHYVNEACRTSSFLFADPYHAPHDAAAPGTVSAVLLDPREEQVSAYLDDLASLRATLTCVIFTHCYVDGDSGLAALTSRFPACRVLSGLPLCPAGTAQDVFVSSYLHLRSVAIPAFSPESLLVEVHAGQRLVGLCTGVLWSTDAAPRWDLLQWSTHPPSSPAAPAVSSSPSATPGTIGSYGGGDRDAALAHTHAVLRQFFFDRYLAPLCQPSASFRPTPTSSDRGVHKTTRSEDVRHNQDGVNRNEKEEDVHEGKGGRGKAAAAVDVDALQRVVLLPTHGGYSNVTNQLDLYWAAHLGDLVRMKHSRTVIDTLASTADVFAKYNKRLPRLPHPPLFDVSRVAHLRQLLACMGDEQRAACVAQLPETMQHALSASFNPFASVAPATAAVAPTLPRTLTRFVNVVDVRDAKDYHALHLSGSVNVPMSFPGVAYGARRAELWLQCVLVPCQPILVVCSAAAQKAEVQRRLSALSPGSFVRAFTLDELSPPASQPLSPAASSSSTDPWREVRCDRPRGVPAEWPIPDELTWVQHAGALTRLTTYEHLVAIEPTDTRVVLDVRTPYEFKNGSHQHSVHVELAEMCALAVADAMRATPQSSVWWHVGSSPQLADVYMERIHTTALMAGLPIARQETSLSDVVIYCAGGYRSLIAASLLQRAMETAANPAWRHLHVADVSGGAFQIMTQRPDLWRVKDRSIICIS